MALKTAFVSQWTNTGSPVVVAVALTVFGGRALTPIPVGTGCVSASPGHPVSAGGLRQEPSVVRSAGSIYTALLPVSLSWLCTLGT